MRREFSASDRVSPIGFIALWSHRCHSPNVTAWHTCFRVPSSVGLSSVKNQMNDVSRRLDKTTFARVPMYSTLPSAQCDIASKIKLDTTILHLSTKRNVKKKSRPAIESITHSNLPAPIRPPLFLVFLLAEPNATRRYQVAMCTFAVVVRRPALPIGRQTSAVYNNLQPTLAS